MSAFVVEHKTINRIVTWLYRETWEDKTYGSLKRILKGLGYDPETWSKPPDKVVPINRQGKSIEELAEDMFALNCRAVNQRYGDGTCALDGIEPLVFASVKADPYQVLKSMHCWHYQCCEGNVPETSELYKAFDKIMHALEYHLVSIRPEYESAEWG